MNYLNDKERNAVDRFVKRMKELLGDNLVLMKLFGSKTRGDSNEESDIDILLVLREKNRELQERIYEILFEIDPYYELRISLLIFSDFEYRKNEELSSPFIESVKKEGILL